MPEVRHMHGAEAITTSACVFRLVAFVQQLCLSELAGEALTGAASDGGVRHDWFDLQVKGLHGDSMPQRSAISRVRSLRRSNSSGKMAAPSNSRLARALQRSPHSTPAALQRHPNLALTESEEVQETLLTVPSEPYAAGEGDSPRLFSKTICP